MKISQKIADGISKYIDKGEFAVIMGVSGF